MAAKQDDQVILKAITKLYDQNGNKYAATTDQLLETTGLDAGKVARSIARLEKAGKIRCNTPRRKKRSMAYMPLAE